MAMLSGCGQVMVPDEPLIVPVQGVNGFQVFRVTSGYDSTRLCILTDVIVDTAENSASQGKDGMVCEIQLDNGLMPESFRIEFHESCLRQLQAFSRRSYLMVYDEDLARRLMVAAYLDMPFFKTLSSKLKGRGMDMRIRYSGEHPLLSDAIDSRWRFDGTTHPETIFDVHTHLCCSVLVLSPGESRITRSTHLRVDPDDFPFRVRHVASCNEDTPVLASAKGARIVVEHPSVPRGASRFAILTHKDGTLVSRPVSFPDETGMWLPLCLSGNAEIIGWRHEADNGISFHFQDVGKGNFHPLGVPPSGNVLSMKCLSFLGDVTACDMNCDQTICPIPAVLNMDGRNLDLPVGPNLAQCVALSSNGMVVAGNTFNDGMGTWCGFVASRQDNSFVPVSDGGGRSCIPTVLTGLSGNGAWAIGKVLIYGVCPIVWIWNGGEERIRYFNLDWDGAQDIFPRFVSDDGRIFTGVVAMNNGLDEPFVAIGEKMIFLNNATLIPEDVILTDVMAMDYDGRAIVCKGFSIDNGYIIMTIAF